MFIHSPTKHFFICHQSSSNDENETLVRLSPKNYFRQRQTDRPTDRPIDRPSSLFLSQLKSTHLSFIFYCYSEPSSFLLFYCSTAFSLFYCYCQKIAKKTKKEKFCYYLIESCCLIILSTASYRIV